MKHRTHIGKAHVLVALAVTALVGLALRPPSAEAQSTIALAGGASPLCSIVVNTDGQAASLPVTTAGSQHVQVGTVNPQNCNKVAGYTLTVSSLNCSGGALLKGAIATPETLAYSVEFTNPTTGGSTADVTGLLATVCSGQIGRNVTGAKITNESSSVFVNFTGNPALGVDTYSDTLTITMTVK